MGMKTTQFKLGDTVSGTYHSVAYVGTLTEYDGCGYLYVELASPIVVRGDVRTSVCFSRDSEERDVLRLVSRPSVSPTLKSVSNAAMGGARIA